VLLLEADKIGNYSRKPISLNFQLTPSQRIYFRVLLADEILALLIKNQAPTAIPMVGLAGKNPWSDTKKILVTYGTLAAIAAGILGVAHWLSSKNDGNDEDEST
jgi:hypothetical protein